MDQETWAEEDPAFGWLEQIHFSYEISSWDNTYEQSCEEGVKPYMDLRSHRVCLTAGLTLQGDACMDWTLMHLLTFPSFLLGGMAETL